MSPSASVAKKPAKRNPSASRKPISRPQYVEVEIGDALARSQGAWADMELRPETAVHLARHLKEPSQTDLLGKLLESKVFSAAALVIRANTKGLTPLERGDIVRGVYARIVQAVLDGSPAVPDFLEAKFGLKVKQWTIDAVRIHLRQTGKLVPLEDSHETQRELTRWKEEQDESRQQEFGNQLSAVTARVLVTFPRRVQQAFAQHVYDGIPIESDREGAVSIARLHDVSGRAVRQWFAQVREAVKTKMRSDENEHE